MSPRFPHVTITGILMESGEERREGGEGKGKKIVGELSASCINN